ncbi:secreted frizzled-related protein 2-like [Pristis pectinata]|uniref:secreted frizzled-related protein 2-like n=1 Tax=Pristis pectinata TaxID=685728 RepID=UPI00223D0690|nr:secreted frizzled-related protein 2-like [Pristis pectinata]
MYWHAWPLRGWVERAPSSAAARILTCLLLPLCWGQAPAAEVPSFPLGFSDFGRSDCKPIPHTMALCHGVGYSEMRLPNLLGHDSMKEVVQQAASWVPLLNKHCHPDTRKFLCSLFAPVCLSELREAVQPCRSLCREVRDSCAPVMLAFGFPWPEMLDCNRFPMDDDLCIPSATSEEERVEQEESKVCDPCKSEGEVERDILANYCKNDFVLKVKVKDIAYLNGDARIILEARSRALLGAESRELSEELWLAGGSSCTCDVLRDRSASYLVMGRLQAEGRWLVTLVKHWQGSKRDLRRLTRSFKKVRCYTGGGN